MTATPRRRPVRNWIAAACASTIVVCAGFASASAVAADSPTPTPTTPSTAPPSSSADVSLLVSVNDGGVRVPGTALSLVTRVTNAGPDASPTGVITVKLAPTALANANAVNEWLAGDAVGVPLVDIATSPVGSVGVSADEDVAITVPATTPQLATLPEGVFALQVSYTTPLGTTTANTVFTSRNQRTPFGVVVPFTGPAVSTGLVPSQQLTDLTAADGDLAARLLFAQSSNAIVAADPALLAAMRAQGTAATGGVQEWLTGFAALSNDVFPLHFADADLATLVGADQADLQPTSLSRYLYAAGFDTPANPTPTPTPSQTTATEPTLDGLVGIAGANEKLAWPATGTITEPVAQWAASTEHTLLASNDQVAAPGVHATLNAHAADTLVYNTQLSDLISEAVTLSDEVARNDALAHAIALANVAGVQPAALAVIERGTKIDSVAAAAVADKLTAASGQRLLSIDSLLAQAPAPAVLTPAEPDESRIATLKKLLEAEAPIGEFSAVLSDPSLLTGSERAEILQLTSSGWLGNKKWSTAISDHEAATEKTLNAISIEPLSTVQFLSSGSTIPMRVRNDLPFDAQLKLFAVPNDFRLEIGSPTEIDAPAGAVTRVLVPVTAGLGNGDVEIRFWLTAANGFAVGSEMHTDVYVRAEWEKWGIGIGIGVVGLLLVGGITRMVVKRRRAHAASEEVNG